MPATSHRVPTTTRTGISLGVICVLLLVSGTLQAQTDSVFEAIEADREAGLLSENQSIMQRFFGIFHPPMLEARYQGMSLAGPPCASSLLAELRAANATLSQEQRHLVSWFSDPWYRAKLEPEPGGAPDSAPPPPPQGQGRDTCFDPEDAQDGLGPYSHQGESANFSVHYTPNLITSSHRVGLLLDWLEESLEVETEELGFYPPARMNEYQLLVAVEFLSSTGTGAYTSIHACGFSDPMAFIVVKSQWFGDESLLQSIAPHELFHAIQVRYALNEMWLTEDTPNRWWSEASAVYIERVVYPDLSQGLSNQARRWAAEPWRALETHDSGGFQYGSYLFPASIHQSLGGHTWHHDLWEEVRGETGYRIVHEIDGILDDHGTSFAEQWGLFIERAATMNFDFHDDLASPVDMANDGQGGLSARYDRGDLPVDVDLDDEPGAELPELFGASYVLVEAAGGDDDEAADSGTGGALVLGFQGSEQDDGETRNWRVRLVATSDGDERDTHELELLSPSGIGSAENEVEGEIFLDGFGSAFDGVVMVASPLAGDREDPGADWHFSAREVSSAGGSGFGPLPDDVGPPAGCRGCTIQSRQLHPQRRTSPALVLGLIVLLIGRRQHRSGRRHRPANRWMLGYDPSDGTVIEPPGLSQDSCP